MVTRARVAQAGLASLIAPTDPLPAPLAPAACRLLLTAAAKKSGGRADGGRENREGLRCRRGRRRECRHVRGLGGARTGRARSRIGGGAVRRAWRQFALHGGRIALCL